MKIVTITTPENIEIRYRLAGAGSRIVAAFIDYFLQALVYLLVFLVFIGLHDPIQYLEAQSSFFLATLLLVTAFIHYGYFTISEMMMKGQTLGKKIIGLKTIRKNGQPMDIKHSLIRNLFRIFADNYMVGILMIFFRGDYGRLGDVLSSTMVIEEEKEVFMDFYIELEEHLKDLTEEEKELLIAYKKNKNQIQQEKSELKARTITYFQSKYEDKEIIEGIEKYMTEI